MNSLKESVLVVDDEPQVLVALENLLSDEYTVFKSDSAEHALRLVERRRDIAVVVSDQRMPKMSGDELFGKLRSQCEATRILLTGYADLSAVTRAVNEGHIFAYLTKPWDPEDLLRTVKQAADHFRLAQGLLHERRLLQDLLHNVPDGIYFKDRQLRFLRANRAYADFVGGRPPEALSGRRLGELLASPEVDEAEAEEQRLLSEGLPVQDKLREREREGVKRWLSETKAPIRSPDGQVIGLICIARDVTERVQAQAALRALEQQLLQSQKLEAIGQLAGGVAHDFNNILSVIIGYGELVLEECPETDPRRADVTELLAAARRAAALTHQLLAFSRRRAVQPELVDLNALVSGMQTMLGRIIGEDIALDVKLMPARAKIRADPTQIEQVLLNLTVNARDAMPEGGTITISTAAASLGPEFSSLPAGVAPGSFVELDFVDTGSGMDQETQRRVFEPFFTTKPAGKGTGLGLATVYGVVQQCGGHIRLESEPGRGTRFRLYFPRAISASTELFIRRASTRPPTGTGTVLLVEDEEAVRRVTARILRDAGYLVYEARDAAHARELCSEHGAAIDVVLLDVVMPAVSGPKLATELCVLVPSLHVIFMSGYSTGGPQLVAIPPDAAFIEKPFTPTLLAQKLREVLHGQAPR